jgi:tetratricopeptide (TPR) repeat protein
MRPPLQVLADAAEIIGAERPVIQDFRPLAESLEWELGQLYLQERGSQAFIADPDPVPYRINNDGILSTAAAEVFFASLCAADRAGALEPAIFVLELGIGIGLFARFFLDAFASLCREHGKDYYHRLCYIAADHSEQMLEDARQHDIFANHPGRYQLRQVDAMKPQEGLAVPPLRGVFLNYLLDCLPATVLQVDKEPIRRLCVRTRLAQGVPLSAYTSLEVEDLQRLANAPDTAERRRLLELFGLFAVEYDYQPVDPAEVPLGEFAVQHARTHGLVWIVHNHGAIACLDRLLKMMADQGFVLLTDFGPARECDAADFQHSRYFHTTCVKLNFPLLRSYFSTGTARRWLDPPGKSDRSTRTCLVGNHLASETAASFEEHFGAAFDRHEEAAQQGRLRAEKECFEAALRAYREALVRQPYNWALMQEVAELLTSRLRNPAAGLELAQAALELNPRCSALLWNTLGESLSALGRLAEARQAFLQALQISPADVRAVKNLAALHVWAGEYPKALERIAAGLAESRHPPQRDEFLRMQSYVIEQLAGRWDREARWLANRIERH